ncbi:MAG: MBL fold metallo-hydrolase [Chloroflexota bacterium]
MPPWSHLLVCSSAGPLVIMDVWSIASGSSGNAYLVRGEGATVLVECGIPLGRIASFLKRLGLAPYDLTGVLLTHDHSDHTRSARQLSDGYGVPIFATPGTLGCDSLRDAQLARPVGADRPFRVGDLEVRAFKVPHDAYEPVGFTLTAQAATVTVTTDLGYVPGEVQRNLRDNDLLILEANHDVEMLQNGPYPTFLKRRVLGQHGHLSNAATGAALAACGDRVPSEVWLAHLSPTNNRPDVALEAVAGRLQAAGLGHVAVRVAERHRPSLHWTAPARTRQLSLF